ncbi:guanine nucleotide-binding protein subunit gamma 3-like isoform X6 [Hibiscus syriacus]|uniref:Guanine nucleotide-binding protein subunit gamma 3-like isoform X6 n=1 Tax=Hibiscus syriacus TaxID=106335 RepID=A0A6A2YE74_HIBSY|nr:guanine nucleotide-binding protein subunit gamma 3-like isoform X6 [Hibiscus syriacus]
MAIRSGGSTSSLRSLPPPRPNSPPEYPDLYGKRRETAKIQMLEREISFLEQEELKSVQGLQPASRYCKEVTDFVMAKSDPLAPTPYGLYLCSLKQKPEESKVMSVLEVALVPISCASGLCLFFLLVAEFPALTCHGSAVAAIPGPANAPHLTRVHASATHWTAAPVNVARATAVHVNAAHSAIAVRVNATCVTAVRVSAALATAVHVQAAGQSRNHDVSAAQATAVRARNHDVSAAHATAVRVQAVAQSRNVNVSAAHAAAVHVRAVARSRNGNASRVLNPVYAERSHAAAKAAAFFNSMHRLFLLQMQMVSQMSKGADYCSNVILGSRCWVTVREYDEPLFQVP